MTGAELLALFGTTAGKVGFTKLATDVLGFAASKSTLFAKARERDRIVKKLYEQVGKVRYVKTIWQIDKAVDLASFYCESHVVVDGRRIKAISMNDFRGCGNLLVEGIAGQGKSIFLRYLCGVELVRGDFIPIFVELRRVRQGRNLLENILFTLSEYGLNLDAAQFKELASSGKFLLLFDAFDEVSEDMKASVIEDLEHLVKCHEKLRIIVTTRPQSGIEASAAFQVIRLSDLEKAEYKGVILKLLEDGTTASELIKLVESHSGGVKGLLKTPLLVTLLVMNYKSFQEIPAELSGFYDSLFKLLIQRHDGTKPGYRRIRLCSINDDEYRSVFEAFCYSSKGYFRKPLTNDLVLQIAGDALRAQFPAEKPDKFLKDIVSITCLLVKDGEEYRFIHKSVQEYYAACFIQRLPEIVAKQVYESVFSFNSVSWSQELKFLAERDSYRYMKWGLVPAIARYLEVSVEQLGTITAKDVKSAILRHIGNGSLFIENSSLTAVTISSIPNHWTYHSLFKGDFSPVLEAVKSESISVTKEKGLEGECCVECKELMNFGLMNSHFEEVAIDCGTRLLEIAHGALKKIGSEECNPIALAVLGRRATPRD